MLDILDEIDLLGSKLIVSYGFQFQTVHGKGELLSNMERDH